MKIYIDTLGCAKNEYDSQMLAASLVERGCVITYDPQDADILIVNTCGFIEDAKKESIARIFELADENGFSGLKIRRLNVEHDTVLETGSKPAVEFRKV